MPDSAAKVGTVLRHLCKVAWKPAETCWIASDRRDQFQKSRPNSRNQGGDYPAKEKQTAESHTSV